MKPIVLVITNAEGTSFDALGLQLKERLQEFHVQVLPHTKINHGTVCDVAVYLWWRPLIDGLTSRIHVKKSTVLAVFDHHSWTFSPMYSAGMKKALRQTDYLVVGNESILDQLRSKYDTLPPAWICETGVDTERFRPSGYPKRFTALWAGCSRAGENDLKGLQIVQRAAEMARVPLLIADSLGEKGECVPYSQMHDWYKNGTVYMIGSRSEGTPRTLLEAMSCGRLIVSTRVGLVPRLVQHGVNGVIVDRDPDAMASGLRYLQNLLAGINPQLPKEAARQAALAYDVKHKILPWRACIMTAATGKWWRPAAIIKSPEADEQPHSTRAAIEIAELQGQPINAGECQKLIDERDPGTSGRPTVLLCSAYRFLSRTLHIVAPLMDKYRFVMDRSEHFPRVDLAWTFYPFADGRRAYLCHRLQGVPFVMTMRGFAVPPQTKQSVLQLYRNATAITALTQSLKNEISALCPDLRDKIAVVPNGASYVGQAEGDFGVPYNGPIILSLTNFNFEGKRVGIDQLVKGFDNAAFNGTFVVGGREGRFAPAKGLIGKNSRYLGFIKNRAAAMKAASVFIYYSHTDGQPSALMEAMSAGLPCVVGKSRHSGASEFVVDEVTGIVRESPIDVVSQAIQLCQDPRRAKRLGDAAAAYMRNTLTWEKAADMYDRVFQSVLPEKKRRVAG